MFVVRIKRSRVHGFVNFVTLSDLPDLPHRAPRMDIEAPFLPLPSHHPSVRPDELHAPREQLRVFNPYMLLQLHLTILSPQQAITSAPLHIAVISPTAFESFDSGGREIID